MNEVNADLAAGNAAPIESDHPVTDAPGATDTPETVEETDEQKNARELAERKERSERQYKGVKKRIDELTADKYSERAARERAEREAEELRRQLVGRQAPAAQPGSGEPQRGDYTDYDAYIEAKAEWKAEQRAVAVMREREEQWARANQERQAQASLGQIVQEHSKRVADYAKAHPEFSEVLESDLQVSLPLSVMIMRNPDSAAILSELNRQPELLDRLHATDALSAAEMLGRIAASAKSRSPQVSKAPAPGSPVGGKASAPAKSLSEMDLDEFFKARRKQIAARR